MSWGRRFTHPAKAASCTEDSSPQPPPHQPKMSEFIALNHGLRRKLPALSLRGRGLRYGAVRRKKRAGCEFTGTESV